MEKTMVHSHLKGVAVGLTAGVVYTFCAIVVALWPTQSLRFFATWFHGIDLTKIVVPIQLTFSKFILGLFSVVLFFYLVGFVYGLLHNLCYSHCKKWGWI